MNTYLSGNTIRLQATFYDFNKQKVDPQLIKLIIYDSKYNKVDEFSLSSSNRSELGIYYYDYITIQAQSGKRFFYEFYGEIGGVPSLNRGEFQVKFI